MYLLDIVAFLGWIGEGSKEVRGKTRELIQSGAVCYLSSASVWEMVIKVSKGLLVLPIPLEELIPAKMSQFDFRLLPLDLPSLFRVQYLPFHIKTRSTVCSLHKLSNTICKLCRAMRFLDQYGIARIWD